MSFRGRLFTLILWVHVRAWTLLLYWSWISSSTVTRVCLYRSMWMSPGGQTVKTVDGVPELCRHIKYQHLIFFWFLFAQTVSRQFLSQSKSNTMVHLFDGDKILSSGFFFSSVEAAFRSWTLRVHEPHCPVAVVYRCVLNPDWTSCCLPATNHQSEPSTHSLISPHKHCTTLLQGEQQLVHWRSGPCFQSPPVYMSLCLRSGLNACVRK